MMHVALLLSQLNGEYGLSFVALRNSASCSSKICWACAYNSMSKAFPSSTAFRAFLVRNPFSFPRTMCLKRLMLQEQNRSRGISSFQLSTSIDSENRDKRPTQSKCVSRRFAKAGPLALSCHFLEWWSQRIPDIACLLKSHSTTLLPLNTKLQY